MNADHFADFVVSLFLPFFNFSCFPGDFYLGFPELPFLVLMETLSQTFDTESENTYIFRLFFIIPDELGDVRIHPDPLLRLLEYLYCFYALLSSHSDLFWLVEEFFQFVYIAGELESFKL